MPNTIFPKGRRLCAVLVAPALCALTASAAWAQTAAPAGELEPGADRDTGIAGRVLDRRTNGPLADAPVLVQGPGPGGRLRTLTTDAQGIYRAFLPPGLYTVRSYFDLYHGARINGVPVERGKILGVNLVLRRIDEERDVAVVELEIPYRADTTTAAAQDQLRQAASGIGEGFGAKQMSQVGASDAGAAAKRVVGVTVDRNQLVVRGLGGRYVKVALNGLPIPTTDPDFPSVDLDLFPANVIDSLNVHKAFLPDIPGDWAGGTLDINTITFPRKFTFEAGVSTGLNSETNFHDRLTYEGGGRDFLGYDDGTRALPKVAQNTKLRQRRDGPFPTLQALESAASTFENTWEYARTAAVPSLGVDVTIGNSHKLGGNRRFGYLGALVYDYGVSRMVGATRPKPAASPTGDAEEASRYFTETGAEQVQLAAIGTASLDLGIDHSLTVLSLFNRATDNQTKYRDGINTEVSQTARYQKWQLQFLARTLFLNQAFADHRNLFGTRLRLRWSLYHALGYRDEPDLRTTAYGEQSNIPDRWKPAADRLFSDLAQVDYGGTLSVRFPLWGEGWGTVGGRVGRSNRRFANRRFQMYELQNGADPTIYQSGPDYLFGPEGLGKLTYMNESTKPVDGYDSDQDQLSTFALLETPLFGPLSFAGGARLELFSQTVVSASPFPEDNTPELLAMNRTDRTDTNVLPGGALKYQISDRMIARAAYGMTVSRPQVRELAPYDYYDFLRDRIVVGNPKLQTATIHNGDLRWEWFFREGQILAFSGFYKKFYDPIELQILNPGTQDSQYVNAKGATSVGAEFEVRSELGFSRYLRHCNAGGNLSLISSQVEIADADAGATRGNRRLAGQAPYVVNLSLRCAHPDTALSGGLVYNVVGPRITDVGVRVANLILPDVEELAFHSLDLLGSWGMGKHLKLSVKVRNLLLQHRVLKQGSLVVQDLKPGLSGSLGLSYEY